MSDLIQDLCDLLDACGAKVTFSANCRSGIIGRDKCQCWRCRGVDPSDEDHWWADVAAAHSRIFSHKMARKIEGDDLTSLPT